jgi:addiction module RelE/StbE family toxin
MKTITSNRARQDLIDVGEYVAKDNPSAARAVLARIRERVAKAVNSPLTGRVVPEFANPEIREFIVGNYRIVYRVGKATKHRIVVLTVFEGHRLFPSDVGETS